MQSEEPTRRGRRKMAIVHTKEQKFARKPLSNFFSYILNERQIRTNEMSVGFGAGERLGENIIRKYIDRNTTAHFKTGSKFRSQCLSKVCINILTLPPSVTY